MEDKMTVKTKTRYRPYEKRGYASAYQKTKCICPRCNVEHIMKLHWVGRGIPKKYCESCLEIIEKCCDVQIDFHGEGIDWSQLKC
jgi:hypothetical protein